MKQFEEVIKEMQDLLEEVFYDCKGTARCAMASALAAAYEMNWIEVEECILKKKQSS